jgi:two-component system sensor histidine kinase MtrB
VWEEDDVAHVQLVGAGGRLLAETTLTPIHPGAAVVAYPLTTPPDGDGYRDAIGLVRVTLSTQGLASRRARYRAGALRAAGTVAAGGLVVALIAGLLFSARLSQLTRTTGDVAEGDYSAALSTLRPREGALGDLEEALQEAVAAVADREAALRDVNAQLRATEQARDAMTHMVIHDLKGPIGNVLTLLSLLEGTQSDPEDRALVAEVRDRCRHLLRLIEDQLDLARMDAEGVRLELGTESVAAVVADAVRAVRALAAESGVEVEVHLPDEPLAIRCDRGLMERILVNLLLNALRHGAPPVRVEAARIGDRIEVAVEDGGSGVPEGSEAAVFERFHRAETGEGSRGVGLGLAFVKMAAEAHGGGACVSGSRFTIDLEAA